MLVKCSLCKRWLDYHTEFSSTRNICKDCEQEEKRKDWKDSNYKGGNV